MKIRTKLKRLKSENEKLKSQLSATREIPNLTGRIYKSKLKIVVDREVNDND